MGTPKIKVYRLDKGYTQDTDNDIQSKLNDELLPFIKKPIKSTDSYFLTGISEQIEMVNDSVTNNPEYMECLFDTTWKLDVELPKDCCLNGFFAPRLGKIITSSDNSKTWVELASEDAQEIAILDDVKKVRLGGEVKKSYYSKSDFLYAHPFIFSKRIEDKFYTIEKQQIETEDEETGEKIVKSYLRIIVDNEKIGNIEINNAGKYVLSLLYYTNSDNSSKVMKNYPIYDGNNYFYKPLVFNSYSETLNFTGRDSQEIDCSDTNNAQNNWIFYGAGKPLLVCDGNIVDTGDYELLYFFNNSTRKLVVRLSETFLENNAEKTVTLYYNKYSSLIEMTKKSAFTEITFDNKNFTIENVDNWCWEGEDYPYLTLNDSYLHPDNYTYTFSKNENNKLVLNITDKTLATPDNSVFKIHYVYRDKYIDEDTGEMVGFNGYNNLFVYFSKKVQQTSVYISENVNWSLGHLRENPDVFFGEKDYAGDESQDTGSGTPTDSGLKPNYIKNGYNIHYMKGNVTFTDGVKTVYKTTSSDRDLRDVNTVETFVRANYSYYPLIGGTFRREMELIDSSDGYLYKASSVDNRIGQANSKRWITKNDQQQLQYFENFTDMVNVCSQYISTAPNYENLKSKRVILIYDTDTSNRVLEKLTFNIPFVRSEFFATRNIEQLYTQITVNNDKGDLVDIFTFEINEGIVKVNNTELKEENITNINGENITMQILFVESEINKDTGISQNSFQIISIKENMK